MSISDVTRLNLMVGWTSLVAGAISGALIGLYFADDRWLGGYSSFRRRMLRLGHIAFFGLGFVNILFRLSVTAAPIAPSWQGIASMSLAVAAMTMSPCCFLTAWRRPFRHLFFIPVFSGITGLVSVLGGWINT
jgi:hypothetical protein